MNCTNCGAELSEGANFCGSCGTPNTAAVAPANQTAITSAQAPQPPVSYEAQPAAYQAQPVENDAAQNAYSQDVNYAAQEQQPYTQPNYGVPTAQQDVIYNRSQTDNTLCLIAFIMAIISCVTWCWTIVALCWMIPMTVYTYGIYKGKKANTTVFAVCTLIFCNIIGGILLLVAEKNE